MTVLLVLTSVCSAVASAAEGPSSPEAETQEIVLTGGDLGSLEIRLVPRDDNLLDGRIVWARHRGERIDRAVQGYLTATEIQLTAPVAAGYSNPASFIGEVERIDGRIVNVTGVWQTNGYGGRRETTELHLLGDGHPFADRRVTCAEMGAMPLLVFGGGIDLGSGAGSPTAVDYGCPAGLEHLDFLRPLFASTTALGGSGLSGCFRGTMHLAMGRGRAFSLLALGYSPETNEYVQMALARGGRPDDVLGSLEPDPEYRNIVMELFREWRSQSLFNHAIARTFERELEAALPRLRAWYRDRHDLDEGTAHAYAFGALQHIAWNGIGVPASDWQSEDYVPFTAAAAIGDAERFRDLLSAYGSEAQINSLRRLLLDGASDDLITDVIETIADPTIDSPIESPLSVSVLNPELIQRLLTAGFDPNHGNEFGKTPLFYAIERGVLDSVRVLINAGADVNHGYAPHPNVDMRCSAIKRWGRTPLMHAAQHAPPGMLRLLLSAGADPSTRDAEGNTALHYASEQGRSGNVRLLREVGR